MAVFSLTAPTTVALFLNLLGCSIFSPHSFISPELFNPQSPAPPLLATAIVSLGVAILLSQCTLWPAALRKPPKEILFITQLLFALFVHEFALNMIWFPLEGVIYDFWYSLGRQTSLRSSARKQAGNLVICNIIRFFMDYIGCPCVPGLASYIMSIAFLGCVLHITRTQDVYKINC